MNDERLGEIPPYVSLALEAKRLNPASKLPQSVLDWAKGDPLRLDHIQAQTQIEIGESGARMTGPNNRSLAGGNESLRSSNVINE